MADFDMGWDRLEDVRETAIRVVKEIAGMEVNEYQAPAWLQASEAIYKLRGFLLDGDCSELEDTIDGIVEQWDENAARHWTRFSNKLAKCLKRVMDNIVEMKEIDARFEDCQGE